MSNLTESSELTFKQAFAAARKALGDNRIFTYKGKRYTTNLAPEPAVTPPSSKLIDLTEPPSFNLPTLMTTSTPKESIKNRPSTASTKVKVPERIVSSKSVSTNTAPVRVPVKTSAKPQVKSPVTKTVSDIINTAITTKAVTNKVVTNRVNKASAYPKDVQQVLDQKKKNPNLKSFNGKHYILSKEDSNLYVFDRDYNFLSKTTALRGRTLGDFPNAVDITATDSGGYSVASGGKTLADSGTSADMAAREEHATTRAGRGIISAQNRFDAIEYGTPTYRIKYNDKWGDSEWLSIHGIYPKEYAARKAIMDNPNILNKCGSWGCVNVEPKWLLNKQYAPVPGDSILITPEPERNKYLIELKKKHLASLKKTSTNK